MFAPVALAQTQAFPSWNSLRPGSDQGIFPATSCDQKENRPPVAVPGPNRTVPARSVVVFDGTGSWDPDGRPIDTYTWYFGDGGFSREAVAEHVYANPGMYMVRLMVTDVCGAVGRKDIFVTVTPAEDHSPCDNNVPPIADAGPDQTVDAGVTVYFGGSEDADHATHDWDFGDGSATTGRYVAHVFAAPGVYTVTLTVTDDCGDSAVDHATVTVNQPDPCAGNLPPSANAGGNRAMQTNVAAWFFGQGSDLDGYIDPQTGYHWNFGDGTTSHQRNVQKAFSNPGVYTVTLTVTDNCGATGSRSITATVTNPDPCLNNQPPVAVAGSDIEAEVGEPITFDGSNSYDNDGEITTYRWTFGDGSPAKFGDVVDHAYVNAATYTANLTVTDNCNRTATDSVLVTITAPQEDPAEELDDLSDFEVLPSESLRVFEPVTFRSVLAGRPEADRYYFYWDFGDGVRGFGAPEQARTAYTTPGVREVSLTLYNRTTWAAEVTTKNVSVSEGMQVRGSYGNVQLGDGWGLVFTSGQVEIDGATRQATIAWVAGNGRVVTFDVTNPQAEPRQLGVWNVFSPWSPAQIGNISASQDGRLVAVGSILLDATRPQNIQVVTRRFADGSSYSSYASVFVAPYFYLAVPPQSSSIPGRLLVVNVTNPAQPVVVNEVTIGSVVYSNMIIRGNRMFVGTFRPVPAGASEVIEFDISNPALPVRRASVSVMHGVYDMALSPDGRTLAVVERQSTGSHGIDPTLLTVFDVSQAGQAPIFLSRLGGTQARYRSAAFASDREVIVSHLFTIQRIDLSDPRNPWTTESVSLSNSNAVRAIRPMNGLMYFGIAGTTSAGPTFGVLEP